MENQIPAVPVATPQVVVEQPKSNNFLIILLSILLLLSVLIAGFFAFQTQKLVKELTLLRNEPTPIATSESVVSPELTFEQDKTLDPTVNWKTYTGSKYSFKYPTDWINENSKVAISLHSPDKKVTSSLEIGIEEFETDICGKTLKEEKINLQGISANKMLVSGTNNDVCGGDHSDDRYLVVSIPDKNYKMDVLSFKYKNSNANDTEKTIDQILSTFKFID